MSMLTLKTPPKAKGESDVDYESKLVSFLRFFVNVYICKNVTPIYYYS